MASIFSPQSRVERTHHHQAFSAEVLREVKADRLVSVILPARDEEATIGPIVTTILDELVDRSGLVDEVLVIDSASTDRTSTVAADCGAQVIDAGDVFSELGPPQGKGDAMWRSLTIAKGDFLVWADADVVDFDTRFVTGVLGPIMCNEKVQLVKGFYERPLRHSDGSTASTGGGRVTELVARPVLSMLFPELAWVIQPLAGEYAMRRDTAEQLRFPTGYGVEIALLLDVAAVYGPDAIAQVDLDHRMHRNRPIEQLGRTAFEVLHAMLSRAAPAAELADTFWRMPTDCNAQSIRTNVVERPPLRDYWNRHEL